ncbi:zinc-ribbon domain-containing protein [Mariniblastus sp.]|nr:zinc-ribbon domain-containing protein [Mariniblastus sp.]
MPIKVKCGSCSAQFKAKDELAGRRVKCPKCQNPVVIKKPTRAAAPAAPKRAANPLLDILDEEDVRTRTSGPICDNCGSEVKPGAVICIDCGFNLETGDRLETEVSEDLENTAGMTGTDQMMRKAERALEESDDLGADGDFGDGAESYLIAMVAGFFGLIMLAMALAVVFFMEQLTLLMSPAGISLIASVLLYLGMAAWISIIAFSAQSGHGIACVASLGLYCPIFGFMTGKTLLLPAICMIISLVMLIATGTFVSFYGVAPNTG